ncbi:MAG: GTPase, partial [Candidatus Brocadiales bacterium]
MSMVTNGVKTEKTGVTEGPGRDVARTGLPVVAIVGRPNVGKSSIFNRLARRRIAIVDPECGVTRDRVSTEMTQGGKRFELMDTGGMGIQDVEEMARHVEEQIEIALEKASILLFVVDVRDGVVPLDEMV